MARTQLELARSDLSALGFEIKTAEISDVPLRGRFQPLAEERIRLARSFAEARTQMLATHFAATRAIVDAAEEKVKWPRDPIVSQLRAELALVAAQCGDKSGFARAAGYTSTLTLDPVEWSPDVRAGYERASREQDRTGEDAAAGTWLGFAPNGDEEISFARVLIESSLLPNRSALEALSRYFGVDEVMVVLGGEHWRERLRTEGEELKVACSIQHQVPQRAHPAQPLALQVVPGPCIQIVHGEFRTPRGAFTLSAPSKNPTLIVPRSSVPPTDRSYAIEYRLWGETRSGALTEGLGSDKVPLQILVDAQRVPHWYRKWWVWTLLGVGVTALILVPTVVLTQPAPSTRVVFGLRVMD